MADELTLQELAARSATQRVQAQIAPGTGEVSRSLEVLAQNAGNLRQTRIVQREIDRLGAFGRITKATGEAFDQYSGEISSVDTSIVAPLYKQTQDESPILSTIMAPVRAFNQYVVGGTAAAGLIGLQASMGVLGGGIAAVGQGLEEIFTTAGMDPLEARTKARQFTRDAHNMLLVAGAHTGGAPSLVRSAQQSGIKALGQAAAKNVQKGRRLVNPLEKAVAGVPPGIRKNIIDNLDNMFKRGLAQGQSRIGIGAEKFSAMSRNERVESDAVYRLFGLAEEAKKVTKGRTRVKIPKKQSRRLKALRDGGAAPAKIKTRALAGAEEIVEKAGFRLSEGRLVGEQVSEALQKGKITGADVYETLARHKLKLEDMGPLWGVDHGQARASMSFFERTNAQLRRLAQATREDELWDLSRQPSQSFKATQEGRAMTVARFGTNQLRAAMVTLPSNAVRNTWVGGVKMPVGAMADVVEGQILGLVGTPGKAVGLTQMANDIAPWMRAFSPRKNRAIIRGITQTLDNIYDKVFLRYSSDVARGALGAPGTIGRRVAQDIEQTTTMLNTLNRAQDFYFRRFRIASVLQKKMEARGLNIDDVFKFGKATEGPKGGVRMLMPGNKHVDIPFDDIKEAVDDAMRFTFGANKRELQRTAQTNMGPFANAFFKPVSTAIDAAFNNPLSALTFEPFPNMINNGLYHVMEYSPTGVARAWRLLSKTERAAIATRGDAKALAKGIMGSAMLVGAAAFRDGPQADERWWDVGGVDARKFWPIGTPYLYLGDLILRHRDGRLGARSFMEGTEAFFGSRFDTRGSLDIVQDAIKSISAGALSDPDKFVRSLQKELGEIPARALTPLQIVRDFVSVFDDENRAVRENFQNEFLTGPQRRLPQGGKELGGEQVFGPFSGARQQTPPVMRNLGLAGTDNIGAFEREMTYLGLRFHDLATSTSISEWNNLVNKHRSALLTRPDVTQFLDSDQYAGMSISQKAQVMVKVGRGLDKAAQALAAGERSDLAGKVAVKKQLNAFQEFDLRRKTGRTVEGAIDDLIDDLKR